MPAYIHILLVPVCPDLRPCSEAQTEDDAADNSGHRGEGEAAAANTAAHLLRGQHPNLLYTPGKNKVYKKICLYKTQERKRKREREREREREGGDLEF